MKKALITLAMLIVASSTLCMQNAYSMQQELNKQEEALTRALEVIQQDDTRFSLQNTLRIPGQDKIYRLEISNGNYEIYIYLNDSSGMDFTKLEVIPNGNNNEKITITKDDLHFFKRLFTNLMAEVFKKNIRPGVLSPYRRMPAEMAEKMLTKAKKTFEDKFMSKPGLTPLLPMPDATIETKKYTK